MRLEKDILTQQKCLWVFAKITYLFDTQKSCITASFLAILLPNSDHIIADQWFEDTKEKWTMHANRINAEPKGRKKKM